VENGKNDINFSEDARCSNVTWRRIFLADMSKLTLGPKGRNWYLKKALWFTANYK